MGVADQTHKITACNAHKGLSYINDIKITLCNAHKGLSYINDIKITLCNAHKGLSYINDIQNNKMHPLVIRIYWLILSVLITCKAVSATEVTFLYWSDRHSCNLPRTEIIDGEKYEMGGAGTLSGMVRELRKNNPCTLVMVAGGEFAGAPISPLTKGLSQVLILNRIGIDAMVPGVHEFDYGWKSLQKVMKKADFPVYLSNVIVRGDFEPLFIPDTIMYLPGVMVGVTGLIDPDFKSSVDRQGVLGIEDTDPFIEARVFVMKRRQSCDLLVALTYLGWELDSTLAADVKGLDVIISGRSLVPYDPPRQVDGVIIANAGSYGRWLGRLVIEVDTLGGGVRGFNNNLLRVEAGAAPLDEKVDRFARKLEKKHTKRLNHQIGRLQTDWHIEPDRPCNLAQWTTDAMRGYIMNVVGSQVNLSVINNGNLMKGLPRGPILERDIWEICPYDYPLVIFQISGDDMIRIIQRQLKGEGEFLTWSGLRLTVSDGKIESFTINRSPVSRMDEYTVVSTGYIWHHFDRVFGLERRDRPLFCPPGTDQRSVLIRTVQERGVISAPLDDRWVVE